jgi:hypothetical protein
VAIVLAGCASGPTDPAQRTLSANVQNFDPASGAVTINGLDLRRPATPFRFDWGDGQVSEGFFPASHVYADARRNYIVKVTANYAPAVTDTISVPVYFRPAPTAPPTAPVRSRY